MKHSSLTVQSASAALTKILIVVCIVSLAGCSNSDVSKVKAMKLDIDPSFTVGQAFDNRKVCDSVKWDVIKDERGRKLVEYRCDFKGVKEFEDRYAGRAPNPLVRVNDVFQWSVSDGETPVLAYAGYEETYKNGHVTDQVAQVDAAMQVIVKNSASSFYQYNEQYSYITNQ